MRRKIRQSTCHQGWKGFSGEAFPTSRFHCSHCSLGWNIRQVWFCRVCQKGRPSFKWTMVWRTTSFRSFHIRCDYAGSPVIGSDHYKSWQRQLHYTPLNFILNRWLLPGHKCSICLLLLIQISQIMDVDLAPLIDPSRLPENAIFCHQLTCKWDLLRIRDVTTSTCFLDWSFHC